LATFTVTESWLELTKLVPVTEIPLPLKERRAPCIKSLPLTVKVRLVSPWRTSKGVIADTTGTLFATILQEPSEPGLLKSSDSEERDPPLARVAWQVVVGVPEKLEEP
jgi:hypothetical protein